MRLAFFVLFFVATASCTSVTLKNLFQIEFDRQYRGDSGTPFVRPVAEAPEAYQAAMTEFLNGNWESAAKQFEDFNRRGKTSSWYLLSRFHLAFCQEQLGRDQDAQDLYREVEGRGRAVPRLRAMASMRLAVLAEKSGDLIAAAAHLADARKLDASLPEEIRELELPALIGASRARAQDFLAADQEFSRSDRALIRLKAKSRRSEADEQWLGRILYQMGSGLSEPSAWTEFETGIIRLERVQIYLLTAIEIGAEPWASKAMVEFQSALARAESSAGLTSFSARAVSESELDTDSVLKAAAEQGESWNRGALLLGALARLKSLFVEPEVREQGPLSQLGRLSESVEALEERLQAKLMLDKPLTQYPTADSVQRQNNRARAWRTLNPTPMFEIEKSKP